MMRYMVLGYMLLVAAWLMARGSDARLLCDLISLWAFGVAWVEHARTTMDESEKKNRA